MLQYRRLNSLTVMLLLALVIAIFIVALLVLMQTSPEAAKALWEVGTLK